MWDELQSEINALKKAQAEETKPEPPHPRWRPIFKDNDITKWHINMTAINGFILGMAFGALIVFLAFLLYFTLD